MAQTFEENSLPSLRGVLSAWASEAKRWWGVCLGIQIASSMGAAFSVLCSLAPGAWPLVFGIASVGGLLGRWYGDSLRQRSEDLLRQIELEDGFGWNISSKVVSDNLSRALAVARKAIGRAREQSDFYASKRELGALRTLDNLRESSWWTQQLAHRMGWYATITVVVLCVVALWSLLVAMSFVGPVTALRVSKLITAGISLVFAGNLIRLPFEYFRLSNSANEADRRASELVALNPNEVTSLRLLGEYQLARAMGPPIPDWLWRQRRQDLNKIWNETRSFA